MARLIKVASWSGDKRGNVVFVHGLGGNAIRTWRCNEDDKLFWPLWLAEDISGLSVFSLGYASPPTNWLGRAMPLSDEAAALFRTLLSESELRDGPIAFVCHSSGGLLVKQMLRNAREQHEDPAAGSLLGRTKQVVFIATPHTGSHKASLLDLARLVLWNSEATRGLVANDPQLRDLNVAYRKLAEQRIGKLQHLTFYEMADTPAGGIVDPGSADPGLPNCRPIPINGDHVAICKPRDRREPVYVETRRFIGSLANAPMDTGVLVKFGPEPFELERSWPGLVPAVVRLCVTTVIIAATGTLVWTAQRVVSSIFSTEHKVDRLTADVLALSKSLLLRDDVASDTAKAILAAIRTASDAAIAGDEQFALALKLLDEGKRVEAEQIFLVVAENKAARIVLDSKDAAAAFRNAGAIAGLSDPKRSRDAYSRALEFDPNDAEALYWHGWLNQLAGNFSVANRSLSRLLLVASSASDQHGIFRANLRLGELHLERGNLALAFQHQNVARDVAQTNMDASPIDTEWKLNLSTSLEKIGDIRRAQGNVLAALDSYRTSSLIRGVLVKSEPSNVQWQRALAVSFNKIGDVLILQNALHDATQSYISSFSIRERLIALDPSNHTTQRDLSISIEKLGDLARASGEFEAAQSWQEKSLASRMALARVDPNNSTWQHDISIAEEKLGDLCRERQDLAAALAHYERSIAIRRRLTTYDPGNAGWHRDLAISYGKIGDVFRLRSNFTTSRSHLDAMLAIRERLVNADASNAAWQVDLALGHGLLGQLQASMGNSTEALNEYKRAHKILAPIAQQSGNPRWQAHVATFEREIRALSQ